MKAFVLMLVLSLLLIVPCGVASAQCRGGVCRPPAAKSVAKPKAKPRVKRFFVWR